MLTRLATVLSQVSQTRESRGVLEHLMRMAKVGHGLETCQRIIASIVQGGVAFGRFVREDASVNSGLRAGAQANIGRLCTQLMSFFFEEGPSSPTAPSAASTQFEFTIATLTGDIVAGHFEKFGDRCRELLALEQHNDGAVAWQAHEDVRRFNLYSPTYQRQQPHQQQHRHQLLHVECLLLQTQSLLQMQCAAAAQRLLSQVPASTVADPRVLEYRRTAALMMSTSQTQHYTQFFGSDPERVKKLFEGLLGLSLIHI